MRTHRKGSDFERQVAGILADELGLKAQRVLLSGIRGEGDIEGVPGIHLECKRQEQTRLATWFEKEQPKADGKPFCLIHKRSREPVFVTMELRDWIRLFREVVAEGADK